MKFLLFLLLAVSSHAQTLKWTQTPPATPFEINGTTLQSLRGDSVGNVAVCVEYGDTGGLAGVGVLWYSAAGKLLHAHHQAGDDLFSGQVISVSPSVLVVGFATDAGGYMLRKYSRRGSVVTFKDTPLGINDTLDNLLPFMSGADKLGFFVPINGPLGYGGIKRFTIR